VKAKIKKLNKHQFEYIYSSIYNSGWGYKYYSSFIKKFNRNKLYSFEKSISPTNVAPYILKFINEIYKFYKEELIFEKDLKLKLLKETK